MLRIKNNAKRSLLPPANEVRGKVIFSQASVILSPWQRPTPVDRHPPRQRPPWTETPPDRDLPWQRLLWTETPLNRDPSGQRPPDRDPLDRDPSGQRPLWTETLWTEIPRERPPGQRPPDRDPLHRDTLYSKERAVFILLECILVAALIDLSKAPFFAAAVCVSNDDWFVLKIVWSWSLRLLRRYVNLPTQS